MESLGSCGGRSKLMLSRLPVSVLCVLHVDKKFSTLGFIVRNTYVGPEKCYET